MGNIPLLIGDTNSKNRRVWHTRVFPLVNTVFMFLLRVLIGSILYNDAFVVVTVNP